MTNEIAIIYLENIRELLEYVTHEDYLPHYREALTMAIDALEKQSGAEKYLTPKKVVKIGMAVYECPNCGLVVDCTKYPVSYCGICGQAIDWSEVE